MSPYADKEKQKAYMREYQQKRRQFLKSMKPFTCKVCGEIKAGVAQESPEKEVCVNCYVKQSKKGREK